MTERSMTVDCMFCSVRAGFLRASAPLIDSHTYPTVAAKSKKYLIIWVSNYLEVQETSETHLNVNSDSKHNAHQAPSNSQLSA